MVFRDVELFRRAVLHCFEYSIWTNWMLLVMLIEISHSCHCVLKHFCHAIDLYIRVKPSIGPIRWHMDGTWLKKSVWLISVIVTNCRNWLNDMISWCMQDRQEWHADRPSSTIAASVSTASWIIANCISISCSSSALYRCYMVLYRCARKLLTAIQVRYAWRH